MLIALLVIIGLSVLIMAHEAGHFMAAKKFGMKVDEFGFGFPPRIKARKKGETEYSLNWLPFGGFVRIAGENDGMKTEDAENVGQTDRSRLFSYAPAWKRAVVIAAGVCVNFMLGWLLISLVLMIGTPKAVVITQIQADSPAAAAGLKEGDVLTGFSDTQEFIDFVNAHRGESVNLEIQRNGKKMELPAAVRANPPKDQGALGVNLADAGTPRLGFFSALAEGFKRTAVLSWYTLSGFGLLLKALVFKATLLPGVVGPVGIFSIAQQAGGLGLIYLLQLIALISINLAVINLIPFPALDGGRLALILVEKIKGSPLPRKLELIINGVGFAFLIALMLLLTVRDVSHWF